MTKKLEKQIAKKLEQLHKLLDQIDEVRIINSDDPQTWDSDTLYNAVEKLKTILQLLADKKDFKKIDDFGDPLILEKGLCSLVDDYNSKEEEEDDNN